MWSFYLHSGLSLLLWVDIQFISSETEFYLAERGLDLLTHRQETNVGLLFCSTVKIITLYLYFWANQPQPLVVSRYKKALAVAGWHFHFLLPKQSRTSRFVDGKQVTSTKPGRLWTAYKNNRIFHFFVFCKLLKHKVETHKRSVSVTNVGKDVTFSKYNFT